MSSQLEECTDAETLLLVKYFKKYKCRQWTETEYLKLVTIDCDSKNQIISAMRSTIGCIGDFDECASTGYWVCNRDSMGKMLCKKRKDWLRFVEMEKRNKHS